MKKLTYNLLIAFVLTTFGVQANNDIYEKKTKETYKVNTETVFEITNKFGNINIVNTNDANITIEAVVRVENASKEKANDIFEQIKINISKNELTNKIKAITEFDKLKLKRVNLEINYTVKMPSYLQTNLKNKYGDVNIDQITAKSKIQVKYGSLNLNKLNDDNTKPLSFIQLEYCDNSKINEFNWGNLIVKYSDVTVKNGKALIVLSKYSDLKINNFSSVIVNGAYDDYEIDNVKNLVMETKYSDIEIENLQKKLSIINKYGEISISKIDKNFKDINIESVYADVEIKINKPAEFYVEGEVSYADFDCDNIKIYERIKDGNSTQIKGRVGGNKENKSKVYVKSRFGDVEIE